MISPRPPISVRPAVERFVAWLDAFGETSQDHQDFYASRIGRAAHLPQRGRKGAEFAG